jgi:heme/copper-type cytochrome/quinol oxidase subunit 1
VDHRLPGHLHHRRHDRRAAGHPGADFLLHNSLFLVAHFHNTIIGGALFGYLAGFAYWFPKVFGFTSTSAWASGRSGAG